MTEKLANRLQMSRGKIPPDIVLKGGRVVNVFIRELIDADVAICDGLIAGIGEFHL